MKKTFATTAIVALALSLSATLAQAGSGRTVIPPSQQNFSGATESADAVVPGAGREVIPPSQQNFGGKPEGAQAVVPGAGREVVRPAG